ncbi:MAG: beta-galactosidase [Chloroflexi bacterium]|nr:beta-galactosidase [Chloroflexota bacterium]
MPEVRLGERRLWVGDQNRALLSGEVHYWRLDASVWPAVLERVRELGLDIVSTYVCWQFHELPDGGLDLVGQSEPRRDLPAFLKLAARLGLWVVLRPVRTSAPSGRTRASPSGCWATTPASRAHTPSAHLDGGGRVCGGSVPGDALVPPSLEKVADTAVTFNALERGGAFGRIAARGVAGAVYAHRSAHASCGLV